MKGTTAVEGNRPNPEVFLLTEDADGGENLSINIYFAYRRISMLVPPFKYHFFVSYTKLGLENEQILPFIQRYVEELRSLYNLIAAPFFLDFIHMRMGGYSDGELELLLKAAIEESVCMISFVSPSCPYSRWCRYEWLNMCEYEGIQRTLILPIIWRKTVQTGRTFSPPALRPYISIESPPVNFIFNELEKRVVLKIYDKDHDIYRGGPAQFFYNYYEYLPRAVEESYKFISERVWSISEDPRCRY